MTTVIPKRLWYAAVISAFLLSACGGGGGKSDDKPDPQPQVKTGVFLDSPVKGLTYQTETLSGVTNAAGEYDYVEGESVTFFIGAIELGTTQAGPIVTPQTLSASNDSNDPTVINRVQWLLSLDADADPSNGIDVSAAAAALGDASLDFSSATFDSEAQTLLESVMPGSVLVTESVAQAHFSESLQTSWGTAVWGSDCWGQVCSN